MTASNALVIIGAGLAGAKAAEGARPVGIGDLESPGRFRLNRSPIPRSNSARWLSR
jgi:hypothetical protein